MRSRGKYKADFTQFRRNAAMLRAQTGLSYAQLAARHGANAKTLSNVATLRHSVGIDHVLRFASAVGAEPWELLVDELPTDPHSRKMLRELVHAFVRLDESTQRDILGHVRTIARREGVLDGVHPPDPRSFLTPPKRN